MGKSKTTTTQNQTSNVNTTTTPQTPGFLSQPVQDFVNNNLNPLAQGAATNPYQFAAGPNTLQGQAYEGAQSLGGWQTGNSIGLGLALGGALGGPSYASGPQTYQAAQIPGVNLGSAPQGQSTSFSAPQIGGMQGYNAPQIDINSILSGLGPAPTVSAGSAAAGQVGPAAQATSRDAVSTDASQLISRFMSPYTTGVYDTTMADFDAEAGRARAAQAAQAAGAGAFGGSRYGLREAQTEGELARARAATGANVLDSGFRTALGAALQQGAQDTGVSVGNADRSTNVSMFNTGESNTNARTQAQLDTNASIATAGNQTQASIAQGGFARDFGLAGLDARTRAFLTQAGLDADAARFGADANNTRTLAQGQYDYGAASQNADAANRFGLANLDLQGQYGLRGAELGLQRDITQAGLNTDAARYAADTGNNYNFFNAGQRDSYLNRLLSGAGIAGQLGDSAGANSRADVGTQMEVGNSAWNRDNYYAGLPLSVNQQILSMYGGLPWDAFVGRNTTGTETTNGTSTSVQKQGLGSLLGGILGAGLGGWASGGFRL